MVTKLDFFNALLSCSIILFCISCKSQKQIVSDNLMNCLSIKLEINKEKNNFFQNLKEIELIFNKEKYLDDFTKESYLNFLNNLDDDRLKLKDILSVIDTQVPEFGNFNLTLINFQFKKCLIENYQNTHENKYLNKRIKYFEKLEFEGFDNIENLILYSKFINFENEKDRLYLLSIFYNYIYSKASR